MSDGSGLVVYEWRARQGYLAESLFPAATFLSARPDDSAAPSVLAERTLPPDTPVMVKTSLNFSGKVKRELPPPELQRMGMHLSSHVGRPLALHRTLHCE